MGGLLWGTCLSREATGPSPLGTDPRLRLTAGRVLGPPARPKTAPASPVLPRAIHSPLVEQPVFPEKV